MSAYVDDPCPARGPGLHHTQRGIPGTPCVECGAPVYPRPTVMKVSPPTVTSTAPSGLMRVLFRSMVTPVTEQSDPVVEEDREEIHSRCTCFPCAHPDGTNADVRAIHHVFHRDFDTWLAAREARVLAGMGVPKAEVAE